MVEKNRNYFQTTLGILTILALALSGRAEAQVTNFTVAPEADAFVRSLSPTNNYGGAGAISVSGEGATNGAGQQNGRFDSLLRFPMTNLVESIDAAFGTHSWMVISATLRVVEIGAPANTLFNRGIGAFEIRWLAADNWTEGTGTPNAPTMDGVAYSELAPLLGAGEMSLGQFTNAGVDGPLSFSLALLPQFLEDIRAGGSVTLFMTPASSQVGFTADSRSFGTASARPALELSAVPIPPPQVLRIMPAQAGQVGLAFNTRSNWSYVLQGRDAGFGEAGSWSNLLTVPGQATNGDAFFVDGATNGARFYRLSLSP